MSTPHKLFARSFCGAIDASKTRVCTLLIDDQSITVKAVKARLELQLGLPGDVYELHIGEKLLDNCGKLVFGHDISDGSVLTACPITEIGKCVIEAVYRRDFARLKSFYGVTQIVADPESAPDDPFDTELSDDQACVLQQRKPNLVSNISLIVNPHLAFIALCVACCIGDEELVKLICRADGDRAVHQLKTPCGRTPMHIACANDNDNIIRALLAFNYNPLTVDGYGNSSIIVAEAYAAGWSVFVLRRHLDKCRNGRETPLY